MKRLALAALLCAVPLAAPAARAADAPTIIPTRDVDVLYQTDQGGQRLEQRLRWDTKNQLLRVDSPSPGLWMLADYRNRRIFMVSQPEKKILEMGATAGPMPGQPGGQNFVRRGTDQVAGLPCTDWEAADTGGQVTLACMTADGVMLRAMHGHVVLLQAQRVNYGTQDPALFKLPDGYEHVQPPASPNQ